MLAKIKTLPMIIRLAAAVLALVAFFLMFGEQLRLNGGILGTGAIENTTVYFGDSDSSTKGAGIVFVGYLLVLLAGIASPVVALLIKDKKIELIVTITCAVVLVLGAIFVLIAKSAFAGANDVEARYILLQPCPIVAGILAIVAGLANGAVVALPYIKK